MPLNDSALALGQEFKVLLVHLLVVLTNSECFFNYYNLSIAAKYFVFSKEFNKGIYVNSGVSVGQFTAKRSNEAANDYQHQFAIGTSVVVGLGYTFPFKKNALSIEMQNEMALLRGEY